jgi:mono/diheme cytochrome c family protein
MKRTIKIIGAGVFTSVGLFLTSCTADPNSPGLEYMPDMYRSPAIEAYVDYGEVRGSINENLKTRLTALTPPAGTIPYVGTDSTLVSIMMPYWRKPGAAFAESHGLFGWILSNNPIADFEYLEAEKDSNPIKLTVENSEGVFKSAKEIFASKCAHCHGEKGDGKGPMVASGAYAGVPDYKTLAIADGQMFYSIYYGRNMMGGHASLVTKKEIWTLVHYIRKFQDATYGTFDAAGNAAAVVVSDSSAVVTPIK